MNLTVISYILIASGVILNFYLKFSNNKVLENKEKENPNDGDR